jgi:hypothetical protein
VLLQKPPPGGFLFFARDDHDSNSILSIPLGGPAHWVKQLEEKQWQRIISRMKQSQISRRKK